MDKLKVFSPAKINLYLRITGKRPDGFHELKTVFQSVDLFDELLIEKSVSGISVSCDDPAVPGGKNNIVYKAAELLLAGKRGVGVKISMKKRIPVLAGLGGGSGNAAIAILGINRLYGLNTAASKIKAIALDCGADVPFFLSPGRALAEGIGEKLTRIRDTGEVFFVLVNPGIKKPSTKEIYYRFKLGLTKEAVLDNNTLLDNSNKLLAENLHNDLEPVVAAMFPVVDRIKADLLKAGAQGALMSGSGLTVFGLAGSREAAKSIAERLRNRYPWIMTAKSFNGKTGAGGVYGDHGNKDSP